MNAKKVVGFLLCKSAFTQRNLTSIFLVGVFFCVYVVAGGKITTKLPSRDQLPGLGIGGVQGTPSERGAIDQGVSDLTEDDSRSLLGLKPSDDRQGREQSLADRGRLFPDEERVEAEMDPIDSEALVKGAKFTNRRELMRLKKAEKKQIDSLSAIENRLKIKR